MKPSKILLTTALVAATVAGCTSTGLSPREQAGADYPGLIAALCQQTNNPAPPRPISRPLRLAVAQVGEAAPPSSFLARLEASPDLVSRVSGVPLVGESAPDRYRSRPAMDDARFTRQVASVRRLARDIGADYLLIVGGNIDRYTTRNAASVMDLTLVGGVICPGRQVRVEGKAAGALVEVTSGRAVLLVSTEASQIRNTSSYFSEAKGEAMQFAARDVLLKQLADEFVHQLRVSTTLAAQTGNQPLP